MELHSNKSVNELNELSFNYIGAVSKTNVYDYEYSRNLYIGLGGTGVKTLRMLKKEISARIGKPKACFFQFLGIDMDRTEIDNAIRNGGLGIDECKFIDNLDVTNALKKEDSVAPNVFKAIAPEDFMVELTGHGCKQLRLAGRMSLMHIQAFGKIYDAIKTALANLGEAMLPTIKVYIITGVSGGAGSGMVIDIPYLVRKAAQELSISNENIHVFGQIYLPNSHKALPDVKGYYSTGYAALKEIDYYMNLAVNGDVFSALYPSPVGQLVSNTKLFDSCTLIGGTIDATKSIRNPMNKAMSVCVQDLANRATVFHLETTKLLDGDGNDKIITKALKEIKDFPAYGNYHYNLVGNYKFSFPSNAVAEFLIASLTQEANEKLMKNAEELCTEDIDLFENNEVYPQNIIDKYSAQFEKKLDAYLDDKSVFWTKKNIRTTMHDLRISIMINDILTEFRDDGTQIKQAVSAVTDKVAAVFTDPTKGPYYLENLLNVSYVDGKMDGYLERLRRYGILLNNLAEAFAEEQQRLREKREILTAEMQRLFNFNKNLNELKYLIKRISTNEFKIKFIGVLKDCFYMDYSRKDGCIYGIIEEIQSRFSELTAIFKKIMNTVSQNVPLASAVLSNKEENGSALFGLDNKVFFPLKQCVGDAAKNALNSLGDNRADDYIIALTKAMANNPKNWNLSEDCVFGYSIPAASFRDFVSSYKPISDIANRTMTDYFDIAYGSMPTDKKEEVAKYFAEFILTNSVPGCNLWDGYATLKKQLNPLVMDIVSLPNKFLSENSEWSKLLRKAFGNCHITVSADNDTVIASTYLVNMPIWMHEDITTYEQEYTACKTVGIHINESPEFVPSYKDYPALMPPSQWYRATVSDVTYNNPDEADYYDKVKKLVEYAIRIGIISNDDGVVNINFIKDKPYSATAKAFARGFATDNANIDANGCLNVGTNSTFFSTALARYGCVKKPVFIGVPSDADSEAITYMLRNRMKLFAEFEMEVKYFDEAFVSHLKLTQHVETP